MATKANDRSEKYCSLAETELNQRRLDLRLQLLPHVVSSKCSANVVTIQFNTESITKSVLDHFVEQERTCCGFLDFTITTHESAHTLQITAPAGSENMLVLFAEHLKFEMNGTPDRNGKLKRRGLTGVGLGIVALLMCELPLILALLGIGTFGKFFGSQRLVLFIELLGVLSLIVGLILLVRYWLIQSRSSHAENTGRTK